jgi:polyphosphate kinase 2 (PPK2 family)
VPKETWNARYDQINDFERMLRENNVIVVKFFLHISKDEQRKRFEERVTDPTKQWKFSPEDLEKRKQWKDYRAAFEDALTRCSTHPAPWYVIPADRNWFRNLAVSEVMVTELEKLALEFPKPHFDPARIRVK